MKRRAARVIVFLLLGAIVNVAVAWTLAIWVGVPAGKGPFAAVSSTSTPFWWSFIWPRTGAVQIDSTWVTGASVHRYQDARSSVTARQPAWSRANTDFPVGIEDGSTLKEIAHGWPLVAISSAELFIVDKIRTDQARSNEGRGELSRVVKHFKLNGLGNRDRISQAGMLPLKPIWLGFAINTIFYAVMLWVVFAFPFVVRRHFRERRIKRGLCPACAYPVGSSPVCTECGKGVRRED